MMNMEPMEKLETIVVQLPTTLMERVRQLCAAQELTHSTVIRRSLERDSEVRKQHQLPEGYHDPKKSKKVAAA